MRFGFVPSDLLRSCASFIAFSFRRPVSRGTQTFQFVRPAEFLLRRDRLKQQREDLGRRNDMRMPVWHSMVYHRRPYGAGYAQALPTNGWEIFYTLPFAKQTAFYIPA